ncbi:MAG: hypothetical protein A3E83_04255 [Gammaproteobacteria bacterium RIFCSPHIGHO2_12_FULL_41_20]|nr:MAG: hypothetical protein A3E83_04255 [Gammaproteobacteria bacterium RIFCSPHIGHO2_12_FULL_41_20]
MSGVLGQLALVFALLFAVLQSVVPLWGLRHRNPYALACARPALWGQAFCVFAAYFLLTLAFIQNDPSLVYVTANSHPTLPWYYRIAAVWGAHEGSILLWIVLLSAWTLVFQWIHYRDNNSVPVLIVLGLLSSAFLLFSLLTSNPFLISPVLQEGHDLNPLLQDPGFLIHPPMLYTGYVGFAVGFAITLVVLWRQQLDAQWAHITRYWIVAAWSFLTLGITLGSWWAYRVLGWGGFWFWDPVENVSLLPWLSGVALLHVLLVAEKKQAGQSWAALLVIVTFLLSLLGIFLVRSGVLVSAHTFANDPARGVFLLGLFAIVAVISLLIYLRYVTKANINQGVTYYGLSREAWLLLNSVLFTVAMLTVLIGTLYPLFIEVLGLGAISVGAPYFNVVMMPLTGVILLIMGVAPLVHWGAMSWINLWKLAWPNIVVSMTLAIGLSFIFGILSSLTVLGLSLCCWVVLSVLPILRERRHWSMAFAHAGFAICVIGVILAGTYSQEREVRLKLGESTTLGPYVFRLSATNGVAGANFRGIQGRFIISKHGKIITELYPEKRIYVVRDMLMTKVAIHPGIFRDLYIAMGEPLHQDEWSVRLYYKPFIRWIWAGGVLMLLGGIMVLLCHRQESMR